MNVTFFSGFLSASNFNAPVIRLEAFVAAIASLIEAGDKSFEVFNASSSIVPVSYPKAEKTIGSLFYLVLNADIKLRTRSEESSGAY